MAVHHLKTWPNYFNALVNGTKTFEVRKDDRGYRVGDTLLLREYDTNAKVHRKPVLTNTMEIDFAWEDVQRYTGRECRRTVTYILRGPAFGIEDGYVVMGLKECDEA